MRKPRLRRDGLPCPRAPTWYRVAPGIIPGALPFSLFQTLTVAWRCQNDVSSWIRLNEQAPSELEPVTQTPTCSPGPLQPHKNSKILHQVSSQQSPVTRLSLAQHPSICVSPTFVISEIWRLTQGFPGGSAVKNLPAMQEMQETWVRLLSQENPLKVGKAIHSSILAWRTHGQRSLMGYSPWGHKASDTTEETELACRQGNELADSPFCGPSGTALAAGFVQTGGAAMLVSALGGPCRRQNLLSCSRLNLSARVGQALGGWAGLGGWRALTA